MQQCRNRPETESLTVTKVVPGLLQNLLGYSRQRLSYVQYHIFSLNKNIFLLCNLTCRHGGRVEDGDQMTG